MRKSYRSATYMLLVALAIHVFACLVLRNVFRTNTYTWAEWAVWMSFVPLIIGAGAAWWMPRASSVFSVLVYAAYLVVLVVKAADLFGEPLFFRGLVFIALFVVPTVIFLLASLVAAFKKSEASLTRKQMLLFAGVIVAVLTCVVLPPALAFAQLLRIDQRLSDVSTTEESRAVCADIADTFSTHNLYLMSGAEPKHYLEVCLNGAAEEALGLQNSSESIAALELLLQEAEERMKQGDENAGGDRGSAIRGLAYAADYDYTKLWDRYIEDPDVTGTVLWGYLDAGRSDCDERLLKYYAKFKDEKPDHPMTQDMADYLKSHGVKVE